MVIARTNLRSQIRTELLERIRTGAMEADDSINEVQLAAELGVSRTPLREALIALESEGILASSNGRGFRTLPLSAHELAELAPIIGALESLALELTPVEDLPGIGARLTRLSAEFSAELVEHKLVQEKDDEWHHAMLSQCPNVRLLETIEGVRTQFHRYEALLVPSEQLVERVAAEHAAIAERITASDVAGACAALVANWINGSRRLLVGAGIRE
jgi:DNA-binding GntR family transcriptional regulator